MPLEGEEFRLLAGLWRIKAAQSLGWTEIEASVVSPSDAESALRIEISENEQREPFTCLKKMDFARLIEEIETAKARERMLAGKSIEHSDPVDRGPQGDGKSRNVVGAKIGMSGRQYDRAKYIAENAPPEVIEQLDTGERTIRGTYDELRGKEKAPNSQSVEAPMKTKPEAKPKRQTEEIPKTRVNKPAPSKRARPQW